MHSGWSSMPSPRSRHSGHLNRNGLPVCRGKSDGEDRPILSDVPGIVCHTRRNGDAVAGGHHHIGFARDGMDDGAGQDHKDFLAIGVVMAASSSSIPRLSLRNFMILQE